MGTSYAVKVNPNTTEIDESTVAENIQKILQKINDQMSTWQESSILSEINRTHNTDWFTIPEDIYIVLKEADRINKLSMGAFDITIGSVVNLWGFGATPKDRLIPEKVLIQKALQNSGHRHLHLCTMPFTVKKDRPNIYLDLSAIAKGFAVDKIALYLDSIGFKDYLIEIGGELKAKGVNLDNNAWQIGIEKPLFNQRKIQQIIKLENISMATSGDYRNYFEHEGIRYSHTIDPRTGRPIAHKLASVSVLHPSAMTADAWATALLVLPPEIGIDLAEQQNLAALFIMREGNEFISKTTCQMQYYTNDNG